MEKKNYNIVLENKTEIALLKAFLKGAQITYETSGCGESTYFAITATEDEAGRVNTFLDEM